MRFLCISQMWKNFPGGAENHIYRILKELKRRGHFVSAAISYGDHPKEEESGFPTEMMGDALTKFGYTWHDIIESHNRYGKTIWLPPEKKERAVKIRQEVINYFVDKYKPDVIITHMFFSSLFHDAIKATGLPVLFISYNGSHYDYDIIAHCSKNVLGRQRDKGIVNGLHTTYKIPDKQSQLLLYPLIKPIMKEVTNIKEYDVGVIKTSAGKGGLLFFELARRMPDLKFLASRSNWGWTDHIPKPMPDNITFVNDTEINKVKDVGEEFFAKIKIFIQASINEDFGMAAPEAMCFGVPAISTNVMGLKESVGDGGIMISHNKGIPEFPEIEINEYIRVIRKLLNDSEFYKERQQAGFKHIDTLHETTMKQYDELLNIIKGMKNNDQ